MVKYFYVYILKCSDQSYYTGITNDIERRLEEHNNNEDPSAYTYNKKPLQLVYCELFLDVNQAIEWEKQIKGWSRRKKEALIENDWNKLKELSVCKNSSSHKLLANQKINLPFDSAQGD